MTAAQKSGQGGKLKESLNLAGDSLPVDSEAVRPAQSGVHNGHGM